MRKIIQHVSALAGNTNASISWTTPVSNGGTPILSYTITALPSGALPVINVTVKAPATGLVVGGLTNGTSYRFVVRATNSIGDSPSSAPSNIVTPSAPPSPSVASLVVTISGPNAASAGSMAGYQITVTNTGKSTVAHVIVGNAFDANAAQVTSAVASVGACVTGSTVTCNFGSLAAGSIAAVGITETLEFHRDQHGDDPGVGWKRTDYDVVKSRERFFQRYHYSFGAATSSSSPASADADAGSNSCPNSSSSADADPDANSCAVASSYSATRAIADADPSGCNRSRDQRRICSRRRRRHDYLGGDKSWRN